MQIRVEAEGDRAAIFDVNAAAFPTKAEARLVDVLRESVEKYVSLVALKNQNVVGHIMFTPVSIEPYDELHLMGLAPMAVSPSRQRGGIGTELVKAGLQQCRELSVSVLTTYGPLTEVFLTTFPPLTG